MVRDRTRRPHRARPPADQRPIRRLELSADRANAGRRKLLEQGVRPEQLKKVAGFADTVPLPDCAPDNPLNRRLTLMLRVKPTL